MRGTKPPHALWLLAATFVVLAVLTPGAAVAAPAPTTLSISGQADYINQNQIVVYVTVQGTGGIGSVFVNVQQARPPLGTQSGFGSTQVFCDGQRHRSAVSVFGFGFLGWQLGPAEASANAFCPSGSAFTTQSIRITRP